MSVYYYLICDDHKEITDAASWTAGGYCPLGDSDVTLTPFILAHAKCHVRIISEHEEEEYDDTHYRWQPGDGTKWRDDPRGWHERKR